MSKGKFKTAYLIPDQLYALPSDYSYAPNITFVFSGKIYFVGIHNKPNMKPLDSKTLTGKTVDLIIEQLPYECIKTNLLEVEYFVTDEDELKTQKLTWYNKYFPTRKDIVVTLGGWVKEQFHGFHGLFGTVVNLPHPASRVVATDRRKYVDDAIKKINGYIMGGSMKKMEKN